MKCVSLSSKSLTFAFLAGILLSPRIARTQVAITEVMSAHFSLADFFELTNFGEEAVDLSGFEFTDADHKSKNGREPLNTSSNPVLLNPGESIVFVRKNVSEAEFRAFWGSCLRPEVQVRSYPRPGLSSFGDSLTIFDAHESIVDKVEFGWAAHTTSFVYDATTGEFGVPNTPEGGGCYAVVPTNLASPGTTIGPIPLKIVRQPEGVVACRDANVTLSVDALGMPRPRFQWLYNGQPIRGADRRRLVVSNVTAQAEGSYSVQVSNGLTNILSASALLTVSTNPTAPAIVLAPLDITVVEGRVARFEIRSCAYPPPAYQWSSNGIVLPGETNRVLFVRNSDPGMSGNSFCVEVANELDSTRACAHLFVTNTSPVRITEVQANPMEGCDGHNDWFEITNFGASAVRLSGYRFSDQLNLADAVTIEGPLTLQAHESVIFVKNSSVGSFFEWWGVNQLPPGLQVIPYSGFSLSSGGDTLYLWSETAEDPDEYLDVAVFGSSSPGSTLDFQQLGSPRETSAEAGGIKAEECGDEGTPGFTMDSRPQFTGIELLPNGAQLRWRAVEGMTYRLEASSHLTNDWTTVAFVKATNFFAAAMDSSAVNVTNRVYRVLREASP